MAASILSEAQIAAVIKYLDPNGDGITQDELEDGFRNARRLRATAAAEKNGKELLGKLILALGETTPQQWFIACDTESMPGETEISLDTSEFSDALSKLGFRKRDIGYLKGYLDPDADGDVDINEFTKALASKDEPLSMDEFQVSVGEAVEQLESHMQKSFMRIVDLFRKTDKDGSGEISSAELTIFFGILSHVSTAAEARSKKAAERAALSKPIPETEPDLSKPPTGDALTDLMGYLDPDGNGVSKEELVQGFNTGRLARSNARTEASGRNNMSKMLDAISKTGKELGDWFDSVNTSATLPGGEPVVSERELKRGLKKLKMNLSIKQMIDLLRFIDPNADGDLSWGEFQLAVKRIDEPTAMDMFAANAGETIMQLEAEMTKQKCRMLDLFHQIDKDKSGMIDNAELRKGLQKICGYGDAADAAAANAPPVSPRAKLDEAKALDASVNPPAVEAAQ